MVDVLVVFGGSPDDIRKVLDADLPIKITEENIELEDGNVNIDVSVDFIKKDKVDAFVQALIKVFPETYLICLAQYALEKDELFRYVYQDHELCTYKCIGLKKSTGEPVYERI